MINRTICFDLDGTLAAYDGWTGVAGIGEPLKRGVSLLKECAKHYRIIIYSCRSNPRLNSDYTEEEAAQIIADWFVKHGLPYDEIYTGLGKPVADAYVDDRAVNFHKNSNVNRAMGDIRRIINK